MLAQVILTPTESKKLIAKAVAQMPAVRRANETGMVVLHPSSSNYFIAEELTGQKPGTPVWLCGAIVPKGACIEMAVNGEQRSEADIAKYDGSGFRHSLVIKNGVLTQGTGMREILAEMGPDDVYVKGGNALDINGNVGVLLGNPTKGGSSITQVIAAAKQKGFHVIVPIGLEKLISVPLDEAVKAARFRECELGMGLACALLPLRLGEVVTEIKAFEILGGVKATQIAAGGLGGAEGAVTLILEGDDAGVRKAFAYAEQSKGAQLPEVRLLNCLACPRGSDGRCPFPVGDKHWNLW
ncbi:MAG: hypothetical protein Q7O66_18865 [Dehalococcoidia bacterium]|nr:hypothetical protein [Dehalococcoidia bacterium]